MAQQWEHLWVCPVIAPHVGLSCNPIVPKMEGSLGMVKPFVSKKGSTDGVVEGTLGGNHDR